VRLLQVIELAAHMRPAGRLVNAAGRVKSLESSVGIGLQGPVQLPQMLLGMLTFAVRRVSKPDRGRFCAACRAIVAHISPQTTSFGFARTRCKHWNRDVIAVDQNWGGMQGHKIRDDGELEVWTKPMSSGDVAVVLLNRDTTAAKLGVTMGELSLSSGRHRARDLWAHTDRVVADTLTATLPGHSAAMFIVEK